MTTYKGIKGFTVQTLTSDPSTPSAIGQVYYHSPSNTLKYVSEGGAPGGSWSSGGNLNTARTLGGLAGSISEGLYFGGNTPPSTQLTEEYNGTAWSEVNNMTETARDQMYGWGTQTAAISAAGVTGSTGNKSKLVELYDGTSWSAGTDNNTARQAGASAGKAQSAGIMYGGVDASGPGNTPNKMTESWNGSAWSELADLSTASGYFTGGGTQTSAIASKGGLRTSQCESWNGTSWSEIAENNTFRDEAACAADSNTSAIIYSGQLPPGGKTGATESWNGSSWTEVSDMATARSFGSSASGGQSGGPTSALMAGGQNSPGARQTATEEWTAPVLSVNTISIS